MALGSIGDQIMKFEEHSIFISNLSTTIGHIVLGIFISLLLERSDKHSSSFQLKYNNILSLLTLFELLN